MPDRVVIRRRGKEWRERAAALVILVAATPVIGACMLAIKIEAMLRRDARGPIFFFEDRVSRGVVIRLVKFRTLNSWALTQLGDGPTHIATFERSGHLTRVGRWLKRWYLDELPQLWNIVRGDMFLIGTRPYPLELYEAELAAGITRKRDMPAGLIGPVQARKGDDSVDSLELDATYWEAFRTLSPLRLLLLDANIVVRSLKVQLQHRGL